VCNSVFSHNQPNILGNWLSSTLQLHIIVNVYCLRVKYFEKKTVLHVGECKLFLLSFVSTRRRVHYSAKRGIATACRPSVCPPVCDVEDHDHIGWKSWKLIARTISPARSLFEAQRLSTYSQGNMGKCGGDYRWGGEKVACWSTKATISLKRVKIEEKLLRRVYRNLPTLFRTVPSPTPYGVLFLKIGVPNPTQKPQTVITIISGAGD